MVDTIHILPITVGGVHRTHTFELKQGTDYLTKFTFNTGIAQHYFCSVCGVKSFYVPRSHPEGISVNARCLDEGTVKSLTIEPSTVTWSSFGCP